MRLACHGFAVLEACRQQQRATASAGNGTGGCPVSGVGVGRFEREGGAAADPGRGGRLDGPGGAHRLPRQARHMN
jgi:hypothetical protein